MPGISSASAFPRNRLWAFLVCFLIVSAGYLYAFPQASVFYAVIVLLHAAAGIVASWLLATRIRLLWRNASALARSGWLLLCGGALLGLILVKTGTARAEWNWLYLHIILSFAGLALLLADWSGRARPALAAAGSAVRVIVCVLLLAVIGYAAHYIRE